jgi:hypothetical protein
MQSSFKADFYKKLFISTVCSIALTACAPERTEFLGVGFRKDSQSTKIKTSGTSSATLPSTPGPDNAGEATDPLLHFELSQEHRKNLEDFVSDLDATQMPLSPGMYRIKNTINEVTYKPEQYKQVILKVLPEGALVESTNLTTGHVYEPALIQPGKQDRLERAVRALLKGQSKALREALAPYLELYYDLGTGSFPSDAEIDLTMKDARYITSTSFRIAVLIKWKERPATPALAFEVRFSPTLPKLFNVTFKAWGKLRPSRILLDISDSSPELQNPTTPPSQQACNEAPLHVF